MFILVKQRCWSLVAYKLLGSLFATLFLASHFAVAETIGAGLIVEQVKPNFAGDRAGIQPGDILTGWSSSGDGCRFNRDKRLPAVHCL